MFISGVLRFRLCHQQNNGRNRSICKGVNSKCNDFLYNSKIILKFCVVCAAESSAGDSADLLSAEGRCLTGEIYVYNVRVRILYLCLIFTPLQTLFYYVMRELLTPDAKTTGGKRWPLPQIGELLFFHNSLNIGNV